MFTAEEKCKEALRELRMRRAVYPHSAITRQTAERRIAIMQEIADDYAKLAEKERLL